MDVVFSLFGAGLMRSSAGVSEILIYDFAIKGCLGSGPDSGVDQ